MISIVSSSLRTLEVDSKRLELTNTKLKTSASVALLIVASDWNGTLSRTLHGMHQCAND